MYRQLRMVWPVGGDTRLGPASPPSGYVLRTYEPGDEDAFYTIMHRVGWPGWDDARLRSWLSRILPGGWFFVVTVEDNRPVATAMALRDVGEFGEQGGELGWVACAPEHQGHGLGLVVTIAATARLLAEGYRHVHLYTEDWRLAAIKTYFRVGYVPYIDEPTMTVRWKHVCERIGWPFDTSLWEITVGVGAA